MRTCGTVANRFVPRHAGGSRLRAAHGAFIVCTVADACPQPRCPTCHTPVAWAGNPHRPFCSARCRTVDLGDWAAERFRIPGEPVRDDDDTPDGLPN